MQDVRKIIEAGKEREGQWLSGGVEMALEPDSNWRVLPPSPFTVGDLAGHLTF